jgi:hypothetical protein
MVQPSPLRADLRKVNIERFFPKEVSASDSSWLWSRFRVWGLRFFVGAGVSLGFLAVAWAFRHNADLRIAAKAGASIAGAVAVACGVVSYGFSFRARRVSGRF